MPDREKVLKGLELCTQGPAGCVKDCPYEEIIRCQYYLKKDALALLKEQEAEIRHLRLALDVAKGTCKGIKCGQFADMPTMQSAT